MSQTTAPLVETTDLVKVSTIRRTDFAQLRHVSDVVVIEEGYRIVGWLAGQDGVVGPGEVVVENDDQLERADLWRLAVATGFAGDGGRLSATKAIQAFQHAYRQLFVR